VFLIKKKKITSPNIIIICMYTRRIRWYIIILHVSNLRLQAGHWGRCGKKMNNDPQRRRLRRRRRRLCVVFFCPVHKSRTVRTVSTHRWRRWRCCYNRDALYIICTHIKCTALAVHCRQGGSRVSSFCVLYP